MLQIGYILKRAKRLFRDFRRVAELVEGVGLSQSPGHYTFSGNRIVLCRAGWDDF